MSEWVTRPIGDLGEIYDGPHSTPRKTSTGPWFLSISSLSRGRLDLAVSAHLSEADFVRWTRRVQPTEGDILFSYETRLGEAAIMPSGVRASLGRRMGLIRPNRDVVDPRFLLYAYLSPQFQEVIDKRKVIGATVDRILLTDLPKWPLRLPADRKEQSRIAGLLGALDDKIAVNDRIVRTYEELLSLTFLRNGWGREPGSSEEAVRLPELIELNPTYPLPRGEAVYVDMASVPTDRARVVSWARRPAKSGVRFRNGDTLLARITPCLENGKTAHIDFMGEDEVGVGSTEFIVMRSKDGLPTHLSYAIARNDRFRQHAISNMVGTSGRQRCPVDALRNYTMVKPDEGDLSEFDQLARMTFDHTRSLDAESLILAKLRDTLLPKLMSGELRVREAERVVSDAV